jgi:hypothetical protein
MGEYNFSEDMRTAELTLFTFNMRSPLKLVRSIEEHKTTMKITVEENDELQRL